MGERFSRRGHELVLEVNAESLERQKKTAEAALKQPSGTTFTIKSDEGSYLNGDDTAPPPLSFLTSSIAF